MLCHICQKNEATVHLTQIVGDQMQKVDLCESCSREKGVGDSSGGALANLLLGLGGEEVPTPEKVGTDVACTECGYTQADFKKSGRLGCSACYETFAEPLESLLKTMHKGTHHTGKTPRDFKRKVDFSRKLEEMEDQLNVAVAEERFEDAAELRDQIKSLRQEMSEVASA